MLGPATTDRKRKRLAKQLMRVVAVMECLTKCDASLTTIHEFVLTRVPFPISARLIRRDLETEHASEQTRES